MYKDIYYLAEYGKLYEEIEGGKLEVFNYESNIGNVRNLFIKREIPVRINGTKYFDIITPYGYGGPTIIECYNQSKKNKLVMEYYNSFMNYCIENNIVSEFIRFHPLNKNYEDFNNIYETIYLRNTVITNLKKHNDPFQKEFKKGARKEVRKALREGVTYKIYEKPNNLDNFKELYYSTMKRNQAEDYYYFPEEYFDQMLKNIGKNILVIELIYENQVISSELYLIKGKIIHAHLLGNNEEYMYLGAGGVLEYAASVWGKENGFDYIHHGGGISNDENDPLLRYKRKFGQNEELMFYIGKKIWNTLVYDKLCEYKKVDKTVDFFPAYRLND